jgi:hypothetical protein
MILREFKKHLCGKTDWTGTWIVTRLLPVLGKIKKRRKKKKDVHPQKEEHSKLATELLVLIKPSVPYSTWKSFH